MLLPKGLRLWPADFQKDNVERWRGIIEEHIKERAPLARCLRNYMQEYGAEYGREY